MVARCLVYGLALVIASKWVEYRFNRNYGEYFFDYSYNGRYGHDSNTNSAIKVKSTDRGVYLPSTSSNIKILSSGLFPTVFTVSIWIICTDSSISIFYYKDSNDNIVLGRGAGEERIRLYLDSNVKYADPWNFYAGNSYLEKWYLISVVYQSSTFKTYVNDLLTITITKLFSPLSTYETGIGYLAGYNALVSYIWYIVVYNQVVDVSTLISTSGSSNCLGGTGTCSSCTVAFKDPYLGTGCLSTNMDSTENSYGTTCSTVGCTKLLKLNCAQANSICIYDENSHTCYAQAITSDLSSEGSTVISCTCESPAVSRDSKCCNNICKSCNYLNVCTECYASNSAYSSGSCTCNQGYYSAGDYSNSNNCVSCELGCSKCTSSACQECSDSNAYISGKNCICKDKFFGTPDNCQSCPSACAKCTSLTVCTQCTNTHAEIKSGACVCKSGYFGDGVTCTQCQSSCKSCTSLSLCTECKVTKSSISGGVCLCDKGYYGDASVICNQCDLSCADCTSATACVECYDSIGIKNSGKCECPAAYFQDSNYKCIKCGHGCSQCTSSDVCQDCFDDNAEIDGGKCTCSDGFYEDLNEDCQECKFGCKICDIDKCTECIDANAVTDGLECACKTSYYHLLNDPTCHKCEVGCFKCSNTECTECVSLNTYIDEKDCYCLKGFYLDGVMTEKDSCKPCHSDCESCEEDLKCIDCKFLDSVINDDQGCDCADGFWRKDVVGGDTSCEMCNSDCLLCLDDSTCETCKSLNSLPHGIVGCECLQGYYNDTSLIDLNSCKPCNSDCIDCIEELHCLSCQSKYSEPSTKGGCECLQGYWNETFLNEEFSCKPCHPECLECNQNEKCSICITNNARPSSFAGCECKRGYWNNSALVQKDSCIKCHDDCLDCNYELTCNSCLSLNAEPAEIGCKCKNGFFNKTQLTDKNSCLPCHDDCGICRGFNDCRKCKEGKGEIASSGYCVLLCWKQNLTSPTNQSCQPCLELCQECTEDLICTKCVNNSILLKNICECKRGYSQNNSECIDKFFYASLKISDTNTLWLEFTEELETTLNHSSIQIKVESNKEKFTFFKRNNKTILISPKIFLKPNEYKLVTLTIKLENVYSINDSRLFNFTYEGVLHYVNEEVNILGVGVGQGIKAIVSTATATSIASNPSALWSILNTIQLIIFMPLNSIEYPEKLAKMSSSLMEYNLIPNLLSYCFSPNSTTLPYDKAYEFGIQSSIIFINIGSLIVMFFGFLILFTILVIIEKKFWNSEKLTVMKLKYQYGFFIRFWIQGYLEFGVFSIIQIKSVKHN